MQHLEGVHYWKATFIENRFYILFNIELSALKRADMQGLQIQKMVGSPSRYPWRQNSTINGTVRKNSNFPYCMGEYYFGCYGIS